jgi:hypothetical protein
LDTKVFKPACPQNCRLPREACPVNTSEDCKLLLLISLKGLYLNVFIPRNRTEKLPGIFFYKKIKSFGLLSWWKLCSWWYSLIFKKINKRPSR